MESFQFRLNEQVLRNAKVFHRLSKRQYETEKRRKGVPQVLRHLWLKENPSPPQLAESLKMCEIDFEGRKREVIDETKNEPEGKLLQLILSDLSQLLPKRLSPRKGFVATNLLRTIISLHGEGVQQGRKEYIRGLEKRYPKKMKKIKEDEISRAAHWIFSTRNDQARKLRVNLKKNQAGLIRTRGGKLLLRANSPLSKKEKDSFQFMIQQTNKISNKEAFVQACERHGVLFTEQAYIRHRQKIEKLGHRA